MKSLNHIYRSIWPEALNAWVAVSELTRAKGKCGLRTTEIKR